MLLFTCTLIHYPKLSKLSLSLYIYIYTHRRNSQRGVDYPKRIEKTTIRLIRSAKNRVDAVDRFIRYSRYWISPLEAYPTPREPSEIADPPSTMARNGEIAATDCDILGHPLRASSPYKRPIKRVTPRPDLLFRDLVGDRGSWCCGRSIFGPSFELVNKLSYTERDIFIYI